MSDLHKKRARKESFVLVVSFTIDGEEYGVDILSVQEIFRMPLLTRLPNTPEYVDGMISLQGKNVPVVNLRRRFGLPRGQWDNNARLIVVEWSEKQLGFMVEKLQDIVRVAVSEMKHTVPFPGEVKADYVSAFTKTKGRRLNLLDMEKVFRYEAALLNQAG